MASGEFCWVELSTPDKASALAFYSGLFGWQALELEIGLKGEPFSYALVRSGGRDVAAVYQMLAEQVKHGVPSRWLPYVGVDSVDPVLRAAEKLGATCLVDPVDVYQSGRMAILEDPTGATFALWQPKSMVGFQVEDQPGSAAAFELHTGDARRAGAFYGKLFGWASADGVLTKGKRTVADLRELAPGATPRWETCFAVASCATSCQRAQGAGARLAEPPADRAGLGCRATLVDPQGATFCLVEQRPPGRGH